MLVTVRWIINKIGGGDGGGGGGGVYNILLNQHHGGWRGDNAAIIFISHEDI